MEKDQEVDDAYLAAAIKVSGTDVLADVRQSVEIVVEAIGVWEREIS